MAIKFNTPLLVYGEDVSHEYGGNGSEETYIARGQIKNGVASGIEKKELEEIGIQLEDLNFFDAPSSEAISKLDPIYISYFIEWDSFANYEYEKSVGFHDLTHEWNRTHCWKILIRWIVEFILFFLG